MLNKNLNDTFKTIIISSLISVNVVIWYEIFGFKFAILIILLALVFILWD